MRNFTELQHGNKAIYFIMLIDTNAIVNDGNTALHHFATDPFRLEVEMNKNTDDCM